MLQCQLGTHRLADAGRRLPSSSHDIGALREGAVPAAQPRRLAQAAVSAPPDATWYLSDCSAAAGPLLASEAPASQGD